MVGEILRVSGGAKQIANTILKSFGERKAPWALSLIGLIVAIPVFFEVALILFIPLVYDLTRRTGKSILQYGIPLAAGIAVAHAFIPPTPGPVAVAALIGADLGWVIFRFDCRSSISHRQAESFSGGISEIKSNWVFPNLLLQRKMMIPLKPITKIPGFNFRNGHHRSAGIDFDEHRLRIFL
jgi:hypothetical protein